MKNSKIKLRNFSPSDLKEVMEIEKISFPKSQAYSRSHFEKYFRDYPEGFVLAENERKVVGYIIGKPRNEKAEIISLAVRPDFRKKGVATELNNFLLNYFKKRGIKGISLHVRIKNKAGITLYKKLGFKVSKTVKNYYQNGDDAYLMEREI